jgi:hypothetical protein
MRKQEFVYTGLRGDKNIIYENVTNHERLKDLMKMFSNDLFIVKIPYCHYNFLPAIIYVTCEFDLKELVHIIENMQRRVDIVIYSSIVECKLDPSTNHFTVILQKQ